MDSGATLSQSESIASGLSPDRGRRGAARGNKFRVLPKKQGGRRKIGSAETKKTGKREGLPFAAEVVQPASEDRDGGGFEVDEFEAHADFGLDDADGGEGFDVFILTL